MLDPNPVNLPCLFCSVSNHMPLRGLQVFQLSDLGQQTGPQAKSYSLYLCFYSLQAKNILYIFSSLKIIRRLFHDPWQLGEIQMSVFINKIDWNTATHIHLCTICGCFLTKVRVDGCDRPILPSTKPKIFTIHPFIEKVCQHLLWEIRTKICD